MLSSRFADQLDSKHFLRQKIPQFEDEIPKEDPWDAYTPQAPQPNHQSTHKPKTQQNPYASRRSISYQKPLPKSDDLGKGAVPSVHLSNLQIPSQLNVNPRSEAIFPKSSDFHVPPHTAHHDINTTPYHETVHPAQQNSLTKSQVLQWFREEMEKKEESIDEVYMKQMVDKIMEQSKDVSFRKRYELPKDKQERFNQLKRMNMKDLKLLEKFAKAHKREQMKIQSVKKNISSLGSLIQTIGSSQNIDGFKHFSSCLDEQMKTGELDGPVEDIASSSVGRALDDPYVNLGLTLFSCFSESEKKQKKIDEDRQRELKQERRKEQANAIKKHRNTKKVDHATSFDDFKHKRRNMNPEPKTHRTKTPKRETTPKSTNSSNKSSTPSNPPPSVENQVTYKPPVETEDSTPRKGTFKVDLSQPEPTMFDQMANDPRVKGMMQSGFETVSKFQETQKLNQDIKNNERDLYS